MKWKHAWPDGEGGYPGTTYAEAQERAAFLTAVSKILSALDPQLLYVARLRGTWPDVTGKRSARGMSDSEEMRFGDHVESLVFGWSDRWDNDPVNLG